MVATSFNTNNGMTYLLMFGQDICFGNLIKNYLVNPNQCRVFGVIICYDPTDKYRSLGIETDEIFLFHMKVTTCGIITRSPNDYELEHSHRM